MDDFSIQKEAFFCWELIPKQRVLNDDFSFHFGGLCSAMMSSHLVG